MLTILLIGLVGIVCGTNLKYEYLGERYDPTPLPKSAWNHFGGINLFPPAPSPVLPTTSLPAPRTVNPSYSYAEYYNSHQQPYSNLGGIGGSLGHDGYGYGGGIGSGYAGSGYGSGGGISSSYGGSRYGYGGGVGVGYGGRGYGYGGSGYGNVGGGYGYENYGHGGYSGYGSGHGGVGGYGSGYGYGYPAHSGASRVMVLPQLSKYMGGVRPSDLIGREIDIASGGKMRIMGMHRGTMRDGRGATIMRAQLIRPSGGYTSGAAYASKGYKYW